jgi:integrase
VADGRISIPAGRMKMRRAHVVPMANQVAAVLEAMRPLTGGGRLVLVSLRGGRPLSDLTFNAALRSLGCPGDMHVAHGFRTTFSTLLNEQGWPADRIERQLAHVDANSVRRAYNAAEHLADRARMMQWWADHLDSLADQPAGKPNPRRWGGNAVPERGVGSG